MRKRKIPLDLTELKWVFHTSAGFRKRSRKTKTTSAFLRLVSNKTVRENLLLIFTAVVKGCSFASPKPNVSGNGGSSALEHAAHRAYEAKLGHTRWSCVHSCRDSL